MESVIVHSLFLLKLLFILCLYCDGEMNITFERYARDYDVFEGNPVLLVCELEINGLIVINHKGVAIVENSALSGSSLKYSLLQSIADNSYTLKINQVERNDRGLYVCREGNLIVKKLNLEVCYPPSSAPVCISSNEFSTYVFNDMLNERFEFNCTVEDGNPKSEVLIFQELETKERLVLNNTVVHGTEGSRRTLTHSSRFNSSFNKSSFICRSRQEMPPILHEYDYEQECSYGPVTFFPNLVTFISPRNATIKEGESVVLTCSSNVNNAEKNWMTNFSEGLKWEVQEGETVVNLMLSVSEGYNYDITTVVCESSFGSRHSSSIAHIIIIRGKPKYFIAILVVMILIFIGVVMALFYKYFSKSRTKTTFDRTGEDEEIGDNVVDKTRPTNSVIDGEDLASSQHLV